MHSDDEMAWGRAEWAIRKAEIQRLWAGKATWEELNEAMDKRIAESPFNELTAYSALIHAQQEDTADQRAALQQGAKNFINGYC